MLGGCERVCMLACVISAKGKRCTCVAGMTVQICQDPDCSPNEHTNASMGCPILLKSSASEQEGMKKPPFLALVVFQDYQTSRQL